MPQRINTLTCMLAILMHTFIHLWMCTFIKQIVQVDKCTKCQLVEEKIDILLVHIARVCHQTILKMLQIGGPPLQVGQMILHINLFLKFHMNYAIISHVTIL